MGKIIVPIDLRDHIATPLNDITNPGLGTYSKVIRPRDPTIRDGHGKSWEIYDEMQRDPYIAGCLNRRKLAVVGKAWRVDAASDAPADMKAAEGITAILKTLPFDEICNGLLDAIFGGWSVYEVMWQLGSADTSVPVDVSIACMVQRDPRRFVWSVDGGGVAGDHDLRLLTPEAMIEGIKTPHKKFIVHRYGNKYNDPYGIGLGSQLWWLAWFKRQVIEYWARHCERYGMPVVIGAYESGTEKPRKNG